MLSDGSGAENSKFLNIQNNPFAREVRSSLARQTNEYFELDLKKFLKSVERIKSEISSCIKQNSNSHKELKQEYNSKVVSLFDKNVVD